MKSFKGSSSKSAIFMDTPWNITTRAVIKIIKPRDVVGVILKHINVKTIKAKVSNDVNK